MKLFEHEGKDLFEGFGIPVLERVVVDETDKRISELANWINHQDEGVSKWVVKAQTLSGKRGKRGLIQIVEQPELISELANQLISKNIDGETIEKVLVEQAVEIAQELFVSITYSTKTRGPVLLFSLDGGMRVEEMEVTEVPLKVGMDVPQIHDLRFMIQDLSEQKREQFEAKIWEVVQNLWQLFQKKDLFLAEINPLAITADGEVFALDAKVVTDDAANFRQGWNLPERNIMGSKKSWAEVEAEKIDKEDHRGAVGRVYLDLPGDIGVIAAGGGASLVAMDALVSYGLKPANYTEFSGNPPGYKVKRLAEIVLAKENLRGAILIGGKANFTDQVETLSGFLEALKEIDPKYPIVVRRDGPRMDEAKKLLEDAAQKNGWNMVVYDSQTSIIEAVQKLVAKVNSKSEYRNHHDR